jgi:signal transduction histidine kinase
LILNMSEINTGIYDYDPIEMNFCDEVILPIYNEFLRSAKAKNIKLSINKVCEDTRIKADRYSVIQIFSNLVDNAVKFTEKGEVNISMKRNDDSKLIVEISDTGIGISSNYISQIYSVFSQEDHGYTRRYEGNGLGLALVKKYCDMNNFDLQIESQKDVGSKFIVTIPSK